MRNAKKHVMLAIRYALKPLVRLALRSGVEYKELSTLLKEVNVEEAMSEAKLLRASQAYSGIALMTGIDRKDVKKIKEKLKTNDGDDFSAISRTVHRITRVLSAWHEGDLYTDTNGKPLHLRRKSGSPNLVELVKTFSGDIPSNQVITEMLRVKAIERTVRGYYKPLKKSYDPLPLLTNPKYLVRLGGVWNDFGRTVLHNVHRDEDDIGLFEKRATEYIEKDRLPEFKRFTRILNQSLLEATNTWLEANKASEKNASAERVGVGVYFIMGTHND